MALTKSLNEVKVKLTNKEIIMVRKVRVLDEADVEKAAGNIPEGMDEIAQAIDWKLWEMLKILQNIEELLQKR